MNNINNNIIVNNLNNYYVKEELSNEINIKTSQTEESLPNEGNQEEEDIKKENVISKEIIVEDFVRNEEVKTKEVKISSLFDDEENQQSADRVNDQLLLAKDLFKWDVESYNHLSLKDFIYHQFIELLYAEYNKKEGDFSQHSILDTMYHFSIPKPQKSNPFYLQIRVIQELLKATKQLQNITIKEIQNKKQETSKNEKISYG